MNQNIPLHPKYGVNPTSTNCYLCGETNDIILVGNNTNEFIKAGVCSEDGKMNQNIGVINKEPCRECLEWMDKGIIFISTKDSDSDYRTGGWIVIKEETVKMMNIKENLLQNILEKRVSFIQDTVWNQLGLPKYNKGEENE